jgi:hypothetical protein
MTSTPGVTERRDKHGRVRYRVRVRRAGTSQTATLGSYEAALAWRAQALAAIDGLSDPPTRPKATAALSAPPGHIVTVEDAARRLARGMKEGTLRDKHGRNYKPSVARKYERALRLDVIPHIGSVPILTLRRGDVQRLVDDLAAVRSPEHARQALTALRVALRVAER